ncbi:hypothetical protein NE865_01165 [Phthorimaea operculella]|nr:hypothetical protein NE865_01165 [Phthorimaea operculella]
MMCLTFNYTFPLHRKSSHSNQVIYPNQTIAERTKKMASNIEQVLKRFKDSTSDFGKNLYDHVSSGLKEHINFISEDELRQYEQMVIMKKYPYLDIKELDMKFRPKNARQSVKLEHGSNAKYEPGVFETLMEDGPNVEISNRGLSGFAIPGDLTKHENIFSNKVSDTKSNSIKRENSVDVSKKKFSESSILGSLKDDVKEYVEKKENKKE